MKRYKRKFEEIALNKKALDGLEDLIMSLFNLSRIEIIKI
jgi:hypothetical protein